MIEEKELQTKSVLHSGSTQKDGNICKSWLELILDLDGVEMPSR